MGVKRKPAEKALVLKAQVENLTAASSMAVDGGLRQLATILSNKLAPAQLAPVLAHVKTWGEDVKALYEVARAQAIELLKAKGTLDPESTRRTLPAGDFVLAMRKSRSGYDAKKVERLLASKDLKLEKYMVPVLTYKVDEELLTRAVAAKKLTADELKTCRYDESWTLESPRRAGDDE